MTILQYYLEQQKDKNWLNLYQGIGADSYGKIFSYYNTNFRKVLSFGTHFGLFEKVINMPRSEWPKNPKTGQEDDKQRVSNLLNASFIEEYIYNYSEQKIIKAYKLTDKGHEFKRISKLKNEKNITETDFWFLSLLMIFDYRSNDNKFALINEAVEVFHNLSKIGINIGKLLSMIKDILLSQRKEELFSLDGFWLISFNKDYKFVKKYINSNEEDKKQLFEWVINCSKNRKSTDCIAHKFVSGGNSSHGFFVDEVYTLFFILIAILLQANSVIDVAKFFAKICSNLNKMINIDKIIEIISNNEIYQNNYVKVVNYLAKREEKK